MAKSKTITVQGHEINVSKLNDADYISISDIAKDFGGNDQIKNWIRTRRTVEYLGAWESINNHNFNMVEFHHVMYESGSEKFIISPTQWVERTNAIGIVAKSGRYGGGTFAHQDIAFEFCSWLSPQFKLYLIKEFQRLKEAESNLYNIEWNVKRVLAKANYRIHTDAIKEHVIPQLNIQKDKEWIEYAKEADILNVALFGYTSKKWKEENPRLAINDYNIRDFASINELAVLANLESINSLLIKKGVSKQDRFQILKEEAEFQLKSLNEIDFVKSIKKESDSTYLERSNDSNNKVFDKNLKGLLNVPPPKKDGK